MRVENKHRTVRSVIFSKPAAVVYLAVSIFFIYKCLLLLPIYLTTKDKAEQAKIDFDKKMAQVENKKEDLADSQTDLGKQRYQKEFFNKLDDGEQLIVLYGDEAQEKLPTEEVRKMFWWQEWKQDFLVWWKNLEILKK